MQKIPILVVLAGLMFVAVAVADTVYMRDGRKLVGKVTEKEGEYLVKMAYGTTTVDKVDVIYVAYGTGATTPTSAPSPEDREAVDPNLSRARRWNINKATLPEPIVFMLSRQLELLGQAGTDTMRQQLRQWKIAAHDGKRKLEQRWLTRAQQLRYRASFEKHLRQGDEFTRQAESISPQTGSDRAKQRKLHSSAEQEYAAAVRILPDAVMRDFFTAVLDMRNRRYKKAESGFARCIRAEPLIAAFRQGRGIALSKLERPLEALAEFTHCLQLRDDTYETIRLVEAAMKDVSGAKLNNPVYLKAHDLLGRYEKPERASTNRNTGMIWLMPGVPWSKRSRRSPSQSEDDQNQPDAQFAPLLPPYDRIISKQALAIPVSTTALLVDKDAIAGADILYVQIAPNMLVRAWTSRTGRYHGRHDDRPDLPLAIIHTEGVIFTPVDVEQSAALKTNQTITIRGVNLYRQMGTEIRTGTVSVKTDATLSATLLPGETVGAALVGDEFAGLLTARNMLQEKGCGNSSFINPADLASWFKPLKRPLEQRTFRNPSRRRGPEIKKDDPKQKATGKTFLVHILIGEKPPTSEILGN